MEEKPQYEPPRVICLTDIQEGAGCCQNGSGDVECVEGAGAMSACQQGMIEAVHP